MGTDIVVGGTYPGKQITGRRGWAEGKNFTFGQWKQTLQRRCLKVTKKDIKCELNADRCIKTSWDFRGENISFCPFKSISWCFGSRWRTTWLDSFSQATAVARYSVCLRMSVGGWTASPPTSAHLGKEQGGGGYKKLTPSQPCRLASKLELQEHLISPSSCPLSASAQQILYIAWPFPPASLSQPCPYVCHVANTPSSYILTHKHTHTYLFTPQLNPHARPLTSTHPADMYPSCFSSCIIALAHALRMDGEK